MIIPPDSIIRAPKPKDPKKKNWRTIKRSPGKGTITRAQARAAVKKVRNKRNAKT